MVKEPTLEDFEQLEIESAKKHLDEKTVNGAMSRGLMVKQDFCRWFEAERRMGQTPDTVSDAAAILLAYCVVHTVSNTQGKAGESLSVTTAYFIAQVLDEVWALLNRESHPIETIIVKRRPKT